MFTVIDFASMAQPAVIRLTIYSLAIRETLERFLFAALRADAGGDFRGKLLLLRLDVLILYRWHPPAPC